MCQQNQANDIALPVKGMSCADCSSSIEESLRKIPGLSQINADHEDGFVYFSMGDGISIAQVKEIINDLGFDA